MPTMSSAYQYLLNRGTARQRQLARQLARGRTRGVSPDILAMLDAAERVANDASGKVTTAGAVYTPRPDNGPKKQVSRLDQKLYDLGRE